MQKLLPYAGKERREQKAVKRFAMCKKKKKRIVLKFKIKMKQKEKNVLTISGR